MSWRLAKSLEVLRNEVNAAFPRRSKSSDGTIGDAAHHARASRHVPNDAGVVTALDLTHDPLNGCDIHGVARQLVRHPHPDLEYVISNAQVAKRRTGFKWEPYRGSNPHTQHAHFAVGQGPDSEPTQPYDDTVPWGVAPSTQEEDDDLAQYDELLIEVRDNLRKVTNDVAELKTRVKEIQATQEREIANP